MSIIPISVTEISIQPGCDYVSRVGRIVECVAESLGMDLQQANDAKAAVSEACANAVQHGILTTPSEGLKVRFCADGRALIAEVSGEGDHEKVTPVTPDEEPQAGFGLMLMRSLADNVEFLRNGRGMIVRLTKVAGRHAE